MINNYEVVPIHILTAFVPRRKLKLIMRQIRWIVNALILPKDPNSKIIVMGDFNLIAIKKSNY